MSGFEHDDPQRRPNRSGNVWNVAAFSAAVFLCSVLGAKFLAGVAEDERRALTERLPHPGLSKLSPAKSGAQPGRLSSFARAGVDYVVTGTIPARGTPQLSPCGEEKGSAGPGK